MTTREPILTDSQLRHDRRRTNELRIVEMKLREMPIPDQADGHATVAHGLTRVSATVFGPREPQRNGVFASSSKADKATVNCVTTIATATDLRSVSKDKRAELSQIIRDTFTQVILTHLYPKSSIDIIVHIHDSDGSTIQAAVNAVTLALVSAGIPLIDYVTAATVGTVPSPDDGPSLYLVDLTAQEESTMPSLTVGCLASSGLVTLTHVESRLGLSEFESLGEMAVQAAATVYTEMTEAVNQWASKVSGRSFGTVSAAVEAS